MINKAHLTDVEFDEDTRKLVIYSNDNRYAFFLCKPSDVPTFVDYGIADIGVVGRDTILEENRDITQLLDLGFGKAADRFFLQKMAEEYLRIGDEETAEICFNAARS